MADLTLTSTRKRQIHDLLKGIETGDPASVEVVNEAKYIQHNPHNREGSEGLAALFGRLAQTSPRVDIVRIFDDGDYVFAHAEYDFDQLVFAPRSALVCQALPDPPPQHGEQLGLEPRVLLHPNA